MTLARALQVAAGNSQESADVAEAIDFDGTNDFLRRTSDLSGNTDNQTFTFSAWVWIDQTGSQEVYTVSNGTTRSFYVDVSFSTTAVNLVGYNSSGTEILFAEIGSANNFPKQTWTHLLISLNLSNTSQRSIYINDVARSVSWNTYTASAINFTNTQHEIASFNSSRAGSRFSNIFLDYTYRDLSVTANRRLFVTADLKPAAGQAALNPILYLPMNDPTAPGVNAGTGGDFTLTGTVARSGRGPNQYNAPYSDLQSNFLSRTTRPTGIADGKTFTIHAVVNVDGESPIFSIATSTLLRFMVKLTPILGFFNISVEGRTSSNSVILNASTGYIYAPKRNLTIEISVDLSNSAKRHFLVNGENASVTWTTYTNNDIQFSVTSTPNYRIGRDNGSVYLDGRLGAVWFNTSYIDLSVAANLAKFVTGTGIDAKPVDLGATGELPTGTSPLIYLPMYGNNAGKNYGTGGDFTVNSGPYTGARGPNEFWGNKADFNGTTSYLSKNTTVGLVSGSVVSGSFSFAMDTTATNGHFFSVATSAGNQRLRVLKDTANQLWFVGNSNAGTTILSVTAGTLAASTQYFVQFCFDLTNAAKRFVYINGVSQTLNVITYTNSSMELSQSHAAVAALWDGASYVQQLDGKLSELYVASDYIDFSQEANRLKFRDAFGNPVNLTQQIEDAAIPNPAIYMRFPPTSFGTNYGTGGNFTVNGTITDGGQL